MRHTFSIVVAVVSLSVSCAQEKQGGSAAGATGGARSRAAGSTDGAAAAKVTAVGATEGLQGPESVRYDPGIDAFFVSSINGHPARKDNNGWIGIVSADRMGRAEVFIAGGDDGVFLHAPKGMAIQGDTLWVADIDILRGFNKNDGEFVAAVGFWSKNVAMLNDVALGSDGALYITDTGFTFDESGQMKPAAGGSRVYRLAGRTITEEVRGDMLAGANGIAFDAANTRFVLAPLNGKEVQSWRPGALPEPLASGPGMYDGVEIVNGRIYVTSWADSAVHVVEGGRMRKLITNLPSPADIGYDTKRGVLAVPRLNDGRVDYFKVP